MALLTKAPKGTKDILPSEIYKWQYVENIIRKICAEFRFSEIRTPIFEHTELFERGVGDTTDVVQKEMYTFFDKGNRSITLRPEGTAGVVRAFLENGLFNEALPQKLYYLSPCFRYEKPQSGRLRQFHQFGVEVFGAQSSLADAEVIALANLIFKKLGIKDVTLFINSIGCKSCRAEYQKALKAYFEDNREDLCETCKVRLYKNPMRILDCKSPVCSEISKNAPVILDFLCDDCKEHFENLKATLNELDIAFSINPKIVRGLDYYNKTVFEFVTDKIGAQGTVCGGGRYDGLTTDLGGNEMPGLGFGMGLERLILLMESENLSFGEEKRCDVFFAAIGDKARVLSLTLLSKISAGGISCETDLMDKSLKAQMKYAGKINAKYTAILGESEMQNGIIILKNMDENTQCEIPLENAVNEIINKVK